MQLKLSKTSCLFVYNPSLLMDCGICEKLAKFRLSLLCMVAVECWTFRLWKPRGLNLKRGEGFVTLRSMPSMILTAAESTWAFRLVLVQWWNMSLAVRPSVHGNNTHAFHLSIRVLDTRGKKQIKKKDKRTCEKNQKWRPFFWLGVIQLQHFPHLGDSKHILSCSCPSLANMHAVLLTMEGHHLHWRACSTGTL